MDHILQCIEEVEQFVSNCTKEDFITNNMRSYAVLHLLQIMAESTQKLPEHLKNRHENVKWKGLKAFRNVLVHDYLNGTDYDVIWEIIHHKLPVLKQVVLHMQQELLTNEIL